MYGNGEKGEKLGHKGEQEELRECVRAYSHALVCACVCIRFWNLAPTIFLAQCAKFGDVEM